MDPFEPQLPCCIVPFFNAFASDYFSNLLTNAVFALTKVIKPAVKFMSRDSCVAAARVAALDHLSDFFLSGQGVAHGVQGFDRLELLGDCDGRGCSLFWGVFIEEPLFDIRIVDFS